MLAVAPVITLTNYEMGFTGGATGVDQRNQGASGANLSCGSTESENEPGKNWMWF